MGKALFVVAIICLMLTMTVFSQDVEDTEVTAPRQGVDGKMFIGGFVGYTLGFGNAFWNEEESFGGITIKSSFKPGFNLGGTFHYGVSDKFMVGGELSFQTYGAKESIGDNEESESFNKNSILFNGLYVLNYVEAENTLFFTFGAGLRQFANYKFGLFGGLVYRKMISERVGLCGIPKLHYIMSNGGNPLMFSLSAGVMIPIGK